MKGRWGQKVTGRISLSAGALNRDQSYSGQFHGNEAFCYHILVAICQILEDSHSQSREVDDWELGS